MSTRNYGIEILRIIAMLMIVLLHVVGGSLQYAESGSNKYYILWFFEIMSYCAVNCFGIITGYVMCERKTHYQRIVSIWFVALFYSTIFTGIFWVLGKIDNLVMLKSFFPILTYSQWYLVAYFCLFMFIPFLNILLRNLNRRSHLLLLFSSFILFSVFESLGKIISPQGQLFMLNYGYSPLWLTVCFFFGAYLKKYSKEEHRFKGIMIYFICIFITYIIKMFCNPLEGAILSYVSPTILFAAYGLVLSFSKIDIKASSLQKWISIISGSTFSVYLIHHHPYVMSYVINRNNIFEKITLHPLGVILLLIYIVIIYILCTLLDILRKKIYKSLKINKIEEKLYCYIANTIKKILNNI